VLLVAGLVVSYRIFPLSSISYFLITLFLTLHAIGVHYTYAEVPFGSWLQQALALDRNHFDRIVHFCFGCGARLAGWGAGCHAFTSGAPLNVPLAAHRSPTGGVSGLSSSQSP
jgi:hypothetical protein